MRVRRVLKGYRSGEDDPHWVLEEYDQSVIKRVLGRLGDILWDWEWSSRKNRSDRVITEEEARKWGKSWFKNE